MNNKDMNLQKELTEQAAPLMRSFIFFHKKAEEFINLVNRYKVLGFTEDEIFDTFTAIASKENPILVAKIEKLTNPTFKDGIKETQELLNILQDE